MVIEFCPMYSIGFLTSSEFVFLLQVLQEKSMRFMGVGFRSSELTAHYMYDLATGLVGSCRNYLSGRRSLCQIEKVCESIHFS